MSTNLLKRKNGDPYDPCETLRDGSKRYMELTEGQVLDTTVRVKDSEDNDLCDTIDMEWHPRQRLYDWATAELFKPTKRPVKC